MDTQQLRQLKPKLRKFLSQFDDCFLRKDTRRHLPTYVAGQLSSLQDKSVEPIALRRPKLSICYYFSAGLERRLRESGLFHRDFDP